MNDISQNDVAPRSRLALCGVLPLADVAILWTVAALQPDYSQTSQFISELGETGRPFSGFVSSWWCAFTFLFSPFALAVYQGAPKSRTCFLAPLALLTFSVFSGFGSWLFPCDPGCKGETFTAQMHLLVNDIGTAGMVAAPLFLWLNTRREPEWSGIARASLAIHFMLIGMLSTLAIVHYGTGPWTNSLTSIQGLLQRAVVLCFYLWLVLLAVRLLRRPIHSTRST